MLHSIAPQSVSVLSCKGEFRFRVGFLRFCHLVHSLKLKEISFDELALQWLCNFPQVPTFPKSYTFTLLLTHYHAHSRTRSIFLAQARTLVHTLPYSFAHALTCSSTHSPQFNSVEVELSPTTFFFPLFFHTPTNSAYSCR